MPEDRPSLPDPIHVLQCIESWRKLDLRVLSDEDIDTELKDLIKKLRLIPISGLKTTPISLWRVRTCKKLLVDIDEFWEPPSKVTGQGRCNVKGSPVLYVSEKAITPFEEIDIKPFMPFYQIQYQATKQLNLANVVVDDMSPTNLDKHEPLYKNSELISYQILREFIRSEFLRPVGTGTEYLYRISASICRVWFDDDEIDGWRYPSVQLMADKNIAIKPTIAREKLNIKEIKIVIMIPSELALQNINIDEDHPTVTMYNSAKYIIKTIYRGTLSGSVITWKEANGTTFHVK